MKIKARITLHNQNLVEARKAKGLTQKQVASCIGVNIMKYSQLETLKRQPSIEEVEDLVDLLGVPIETLFPKGYDVFIDTISRFERVKEAEIQDLTLRGEETYKKTLLLETKNAVNKAVSKLDDKHKKILEMRFGLNGYKPLTLKEIGKEFGVTQERIRCLEARGLAILQYRHSDELRKSSEFEEKSEENFRKLYESN